MKMFYQRQDSRRRDVPGRDRRVVGHRVQSLDRNAVLEHGREGPLHTVRTSHQDGTNKNAAFEPVSPFVCFSRLLRHDLAAHQKKKVENSSPSVTSDSSNSV